MKKYIYKITPIVILMACLTSCDLDKYPYNSISQDQAFQTVKDAANFRQGLYSNLRSSLSGKYIYNLDYMTDLVNITTEYGNRGGDLYRWEITSSDYDARDYWQALYSTIANANNLLDNSSKIATKTDAEKAQLDQYIAEAKLIRALSFHKLALRYAKDYEPNTATTDLGMPLSLNYDPNAKPSRATLQQTYDQILKDINEALPSLSDKPASGMLGKNAAYALLTRVNLSMHKWDDAIAAADKIISKYALIKTADGLTKMWKDDAGTEIITSLALTPDELVGQISVYINYSEGNKTNIPDLIPTKGLLDMYEASDIRKTVFFVQDFLLSKGTKYPIVLGNKYPGNPLYFKTPLSNYYNRNKIFTISEVIMNKAEAAIKKGGSDDIALAAINAIREARGLTALIGISGDVLQKAYRDERTRELVFEGDRLDALKRWHLGFQRMLPQNPDVTIPGDTYSELKIEANNKKFVWEIPYNDLQSNPNLTPNW